MAFLTQNTWLGIECQDFKEDDLKSDMTTDDVNFILALCLVIKNKNILYLKGLM